MTCRFRLPETITGIQEIARETPVPAMAGYCRLVLYSTGRFMGGGCWVARTRHTCPAEGSHEGVVHAGRAEGGSGAADAGS